MSPPRAPARSAALLHPLPAEAGTLEHAAAPRAHAQWAAAGQPLDPAQLLGVLIGAGAGVGLLLWGARRFFEAGMLERTRREDILRSAGLDPGPQAPQRRRSRRGRVLAWLLGAAALILSIYILRRSWPDAPLWISAVPAGAVALFWAGRRIAFDLAAAAAVDRKTRILRFACGLSGLVLYNTLVFRRFGWSPGSIVGAATSVLFSLGVPLLVTLAQRHLLLRAVRDANPARALAALRAAEIVNVDPAAAALARAEIHHRAGELAPAEAAARTAVDYSSDTRSMAVALTTLGRVLAGRGELAQADRVLRAAIATYPQRSGAYAALAELHAGDPLCAAEVVELADVALHYAGCETALTQQSAERLARVRTARANALAALSTPPE